MLITSFRPAIGQKQWPVSTANGRWSGRTSSLGLLPYGTSRLAQARGAETARFGPRRQPGADQSEHRCARLFVRAAVSPAPGWLVSTAANRRTWRDSRKASATARDGNKPGAGLRAAWRFRSSARVGLDRYGCRADCPGRMVVIVSAWRCDSFQTSSARQNTLVTLGAAGVSSSAPAAVVSKRSISSV